MFEVKESVSSPLNFELLMNFVRLMEDEWEGRRRGGKVWEVSGYPHLVTKHSRCQAAVRVLILNVSHSPLRLW